MVEVVRGAGITFIIKVLSAGFAFAFNVLLARIVGAEGAGIYFLSLTIVTISATIGRFGLENTFLRFVAAHAAKNEWGSVKGVFQKGMLISVAVSTLISVLLFILAPILAQQLFHKSELEMPLRLMALAVVPLALYWLIAEALKGVKKIRDSQLVQGLIFPVLTCAGLFLLCDDSGVESVASIYTIGAFIVLLCGFFFWRRAVSGFKESVVAYSWKKILNSCTPLLWIQLMYLVMQWSSILLLGIWGTKAEVGVFGVASRTAMLTNFILVSVNSIVAPKFSALYCLGDMDGLAVIARKSTKMMTAFATPILLVFVIFPNFVMSIFGESFSGGGVFLIILSIGQFVNVATGSVGYLLIMTGNERLMRNNTLVVGSLSILLNVIFIPLLGALGATIATSFAMAVLNLGAFFLTWRKLGIWTLPFMGRGR
ncbi:flippase [Desulfobacter hydrogenophilus]|nr:flippase [Desulfobacter hydrogenophilus]NDY74285.1 flippase [Desulfobacter hydrogenophilus]